METILLIFHRHYIVIDSHLKNIDGNRLKVTKIINMETKICLFYFYKKVSIGYLKNIKVIKFFRISQLCKYYN